MNYSTFLSASAALLTAACASTPLVVPDALRPATNESLATTVGARGVQIYECRARKDGGGHEWAFVAPDADLLDAQGKTIGRHGAGPYWQATDGSRVVGTVKARAEAPESGSIPWLLLTTKSSGPSRCIQQRHQHPAREHGGRHRTRDAVYARSSPARRRVFRTRPTTASSPRASAGISFTHTHTHRNSHVTGTSQHRTPHADRDAARRYRPQRECRRHHRLEHQDRRIHRRIEARHATRHPRDGAGADRRLRGGAGEPRRRLRGGRCRGRPSRHAGEAAAGAAGCDRGGLPGRAGHDCRGAREGRRHRPRRARRWHDVRTARQRLHRRRSVSATHDAPASTCRPRRLRHRRGRCARRGSSRARRSSVSARRPR